MEKGLQKGHGKQITAKKFESDKKKGGKGGERGQDSKREECMSPSLRGCDSIGVAKVALGLYHTHSGGLPKQAGILSKGGKSVLKASGGKKRGSCERAV